MALDPETPLAVQLGIDDEAATRALVGRLLLQVVHDVNGHLGAAVLRGASVGRRLTRVGEHLAEGDLRAAEERLDQLAASHEALQEALVELKGLLNRLRDAAWELEAEGP